MPPLDVTPVPEGTPVTFDTMALAYLQDFQLQGYRSFSAARTRVDHLRRFFGGWTPDRITTESVRQYQWQRRQAGAAASTVNRDTSVLSALFHLAIRRGQFDRKPFFPKRLEERPPRHGFFEHHEFLAVRQYVPPSFRHVLDFAYYSGWRRNEIEGLTWSEVDLPGGVIRLSPARSKTKTGRVLPISPPLREVLARRQLRRQPDDPLVFRRDGVAVRDWQTALAEACAKARAAADLARLPPDRGPQPRARGRPGAGRDDAHRPQDAFCV